MHHTAAPVLADAASVLSNQLKTHLRRLARVVKPHIESLDRRFEQRLVKLGFEAGQRATLVALTVGAASRIVSRGGSVQTFLEQVDYSGRRLAKLNVAPGRLVQVLSEYDRLLEPYLRCLEPDERVNFAWVKEQLQFCAVLTLNRAYHRVRETEAGAFYGLFRAEVEARTLDQLLAGSLSVLRAFCGAQEAHFYLLGDDGSGWIRRATVREGEQADREVNPAPGLRSLSRRLAKPVSLSTRGRSVEVLPDPSWRERLAWAWSVPLIAGRKVAGVMQFGFRKRYDWLPREMELLEAAAERCMAAVEKARLMEDLAARRAEIQHLAEQMLQIEEVERRRISRELHDEAGQALLYIRLQLELLEEAAVADEGGTKARLRQIREVTERTIVDMRRLIAALSPAVLEQLGLAAALRQLVSRLRQVHPCRVRLHLTELRCLPKRIETVVYRLAQECCNNIAKHSQAANVSMTVTSADGRLRLSVGDDGIGFAVEEALAKGNTFGLAGMRERVALLGGRLRVESGGADARQRGTGTRITAEVPLPQESVNQELERERWQPGGSP